MKKNNKLLAASIACLALSTISATASARHYTPQQNRISSTLSHQRSDNTTLNVGVYGEQVNYREINNNSTVLDSEKGTLPGIALQLSHRFSHYNIALDMHYANGRLRYHGATWGGTPLSFDGQHAVFGAYLQASRPFRLNANTFLSPLLRIGYRDWYRATDYDTRPGDYEEEYQNSYFAAGLDVTYLINARFYVDLNGAIGRTFNATVDANPLGYNETMNLGSDWYYAMGAALGFQLCPQWVVSLFGDYTHFSFNKSRPDVNGVYEPRSKTQDFRYGLRIGYSF